MMLSRKRLALLAVLLLAALVSSTGCSSSDGYEYTDDGYEDVDQNPSATDDASGPPVAANEIPGHWTSGVYGDTYIQLGGASVKMIYASYDGRVVGRLDGVTFVGWWTEAPTRKPSRDAGEIQFTFARSGGGLRAAGKWRNGTTGEFNTDWVMVKVGDVIPPAIRTAFTDPTGFVPRPTASVAPR